MRTLGGPILALLLQGDGGGVSEGSATSMADGYGRASGKLGVATVTHPHAASAAQPNTIGSSQFPML